MYQVSRNKRKLIRTRIIVCIDQLSPPDTSGGAKQTKSPVLEITTEYSSIYHLQISTQLMEAPGRVWTSPCRRPALADPGLDPTVEIQCI
jgi:hypothetical protein